MFDHLQKICLFSDGRPLRQCQIEAIKALLESFYQDQKTKMPLTVARLLFEEQFDSFPTKQATTTTGTTNDAQRRIMLIN